LKGIWVVPLLASILILGMLGLFQETYAVDEPQFLFKFGTFGTATGEFKSPTGVAFDSSDNLYVIENQNWRVQKFDDQGNSLLTWGSLCRLFNFQTGCVTPPGGDLGDGQFADPVGIEVDSNDKVYVSDKNNRRIQVFDSIGNLLLKFGEQVCDIQFPNNPGIQCNANANGAIEIGDGQFQLNRDMDIDDSGKIYVADSNNHRIQIFDSSGKFLFKFGTLCDVVTNPNPPDPGCVDPVGPLERGDGQFNRAEGIQLDSSGDIYVADWDNHRIQVFDSNGNFMTKFGKNGGDGSSGSSDGEFTRPTDIAFDKDGNIYVADSSNHRIQVFDSDHNFLTKVGSFGTNDGQFKFPHDLEIHSFGIIYVADSSNHRIQVFGPINPPEPVPFSGKFIGKHGDGDFKTKGKYKIDGEKFKRITGIGTFEIIGDDRCNPLTATNTLDFGDGNAITMDVSGEICSRKFLSTFKGTFDVTGGTGEFIGADGSGDISTLIGKKHFGGKLTGELTLPSGAQ